MKHATTLISVIAFVAEQVSAFSGPFLEHNNRAFRKFFLSDRITLHETISVKDGPTSVAFDLEGRHQEIKTDNVQGASMEMWLDLRGTAISPRVAFHHLTHELMMTEEGDDSENNEEDDETKEDSGCISINRVLVSDMVKQEYARQFLPHSTMKPLDAMVNNDVLLVTDKTCNEHYWKVVRASTYFNQQDSQIAGELVIMKGRQAGKTTNVGLVDPIPALECISRGGWVIVDSQEIEDDTERFHAVSSLVELLASSASLTFSSLTLFGNGNSGDTSDDVGMSAKSSPGGIAVVCGSNTDIFSFAPLIQLIRSYGGTSLSSTESGILISQNSGASSLEADRATRKIQTALVLPFDSSLWKTSSLFLQECEYST